MYEKSKKEYIENLCKINYIEAYLNLIDKSQVDEIEKVQSNYTQCLDKKQSLSKDEAEFFLTQLIFKRNDIAYNFYKKNQERFKESYGDNLLILESYLEETFFLDDTDTIVARTAEQDKLTKESIDSFEETVNKYINFSEKIERESKEKGFERPIKKGFVDYIIYSTAIKFYSQHGEVERYTHYLIKYNTVEKLESYILIFNWFSNFI